MRDKHEKERLADLIEELVKLVEGRCGQVRLKE